MLIQEFYSTLLGRSNFYDWTKLDIPSCYQWITTFNKVDEQHAMNIGLLIIHGYTVEKLGKLSVVDQKKEIEGLLNNRRKQGVYSLRVGEGGKDRKGLWMNFHQLPTDLQKIVLVYLFEYISESGIPESLVKSN